MASAGSAQFPGGIAPPPPAANPNDQAKQANVDAAPSASATNTSQVNGSLCPGTFEELHKKCKGIYQPYHTARCNFNKRHKYHVRSVSQQIMLFTAIIYTCRRTIAA